MCVIMQFVFATICLFGVFQTIGAGGKWTPCTDVIKARLSSIDNKTKIALASNSYSEFRDVDKTDISKYARWYQPVTVDRITAVLFTTEVTHEERIQLANDSNTKTEVRLGDLAVAILFAEYDDGNKGKIWAVHKVFKNIYGDFYQAIRLVYDLLLQESIKKVDSTVKFSGKWFYGKPTLNGTQLQAIKDQLLSSAQIDNGQFEFVANCEMLTTNIICCICTFTIEACIGYAAVAITNAKDTPITVEVSDVVYLNTYWRIAQTQIDNFPLRLVDWHPLPNELDQSLQEVVKDYLVLNNFLLLKTDITLVNKGYGTIKPLQPDPHDRTKSHVVTYQWRTDKLKLQIFYAMIMATNTRIETLMLTHIGEFKEFVWEAQADSDLIYCKFMIWDKIFETRYHLTLIEELKEAIEDSLTKDKSPGQAKYEFPYTPYVKFDNNPKKKLKLETLYRGNIRIDQVTSIKNDKQTSLTIELHEAFFFTESTVSSQKLYFATIVGRGPNRIIFSRTMEALLTCDVRNYYLHQTKNKRQSIYWKNKIPNSWKEITGCVGIPDIIVKQAATPKFIKILSQKYPLTKEIIAKFDINGVVFGTRGKGKEADRYAVIEIKKVKSKKEDTEEIKFLSMPMVEDASPSPMYADVKIALDYSDLDYMD